MDLNAVLVLMSLAVIALVAMALIQGNA